MLTTSQLTNNGPLLGGEGPEQPKDKLHGTWRAIPTSRIWTSGSSGSERINVHSVTVEFWALLGL
jgi:hypothetical protein